MSWRNDLDRYITTPPDDNFTPWCEMVDNKFTDDFYNRNTDWITTPSGQCNKWLNELYNRNIEPEKASLLIERAYSIFIITRNKKLIGKYFIILDLKFSDFMKDEKGNIILFDTYDEANSTCFIYEFPKFLICRIEENY